MEAEHFKIVCRSVIPDIKFKNENDDIIAYVSEDKPFAKITWRNIDGSLFDECTGMAVFDGEKPRFVSDYDISHELWKSVEEWLVDKMKIFKSDDEPQNKKVKDLELTLTFQELKPEHIELFKTNRQPILAKLKQGWWDIIYYYETTTVKIENGKRVKFTIHEYESTNCEDCWYDEDIDSWAFLPRIEKEN